MDIRSRLIGRCGTFFSDPSRVEVDGAALLRRLLLFDTFILKSTRLLEVPGLVSMFGAGGLITLLTSGALQIECEAIAIGDVGQATVLPARRQKGALPPCSFCLNVVKSADRDEYLSTCLRNVHDARVTLKEAIKLKQAIVCTRLVVPDNLGYDALKAVPDDLRSRELLLDVAVRAAKRVAALDIPRTSLVIRAHQIDAEDFGLESNLGELASVSKQQEHEILRAAALAVADLNFRIEEMRTFKALSGVLGEDVPVLTRKFDFLAREIAPQSQERRFSRVIEVAGLPDADGLSKVDVDKLLEVRNSPECREFRQWLEGIDSVSDEELRRRLVGLKARTDTLLQGRSGKTLRFLTTTGLGLIPGAGLAIGTVAGALDTFLVDKVFHASGPTAFVNRMYPSLFSRENAG